MMEANDTEKWRLTVDCRWEGEVCNRVHLKISNQGAQSRQMKDLDLFIDMGAKWGYIDRDRWCTN